VTDRLSFEEGEERGDVKKGGRTKEGFSSVKTRQNKWSGGELLELRLLDKK
jgi:hypothetical protein